ncbi:hypothetical protein D3C81_792080 [compost metagenome]
MHLRRRQRLARGQAADEGIADIQPAQVLADDVLAHQRRRDLQLEVELEAAQVGRVDLPDRIGDPDHRHRILLERLVDPRLAVDRRARIFLPEQAHQLARAAGEHVFHLIEQQRGMRAAAQEGLRHLQRAVAVLARQAVAVAVQAIHLVQLAAGLARQQAREFRLAGAGRPVDQHVDAAGVLARGVGQQRAQVAGIGLDMRVVGNSQRGRRGRAGEHRHHLGFVGVIAQQHVQQAVGQAHQVAQVGHAVLGQRLLDQVQRFQPRARAQRRRHVGGPGAGQAGQDLERFLAVRHLAIDHDRAQVALVLGQRRVQQQLALVVGQVQHAAEHVDIAHQQHALAVQPLRDGGGRGVEYGEHVLGVVLDVLVEVIEQRAFVKGAVPLAVAIQEFLGRQPRRPLPRGHVGAAGSQEALHAQHHPIWPHHFLRADGQHVVDIAAQVEAWTQCAHHAQGKLRAHPVQRGAGRHPGHRAQERRSVIFSGTCEIHGRFPELAVAGPTDRRTASSAVSSYASALCRPPRTGERTGRQRPWPGPPKPVDPCGRANPRKTAPTAPQCSLIWRYNLPRQKIPVATHKSQQIRIIIVYTSQLTRCPRVALPRQPS